jgi:hypothetical protein
MGWFGSVSLVRYIQFYLCKHLFFSILLNYWDTALEWNMTLWNPYPIPKELSTIPAATPVLTSTVLWTTTHLFRNGQAAALKVLPNITTTLLHLKEDFAWIHLAMVIFIVFIVSA